MLLMLNDIEDKDSRVRTDTISKAQVEVCKSLTFCFLLQQRSHACDIGVAIS